MISVLSVPSAFCRHQGDFDGLFADTDSQGALIAAEGPVEDPPSRVKLGPFVVENRAVGAVDLGDDVSLSIGSRGDPSGPGGRDSKRSWRIRSAG